MKKIEPWLDTQVASDSISVLFFNSYLTKNKRVQRKCGLMLI